MKRVLLIDDEPRWIEFIKDSLVEFEIVAISNTDAALESISDIRFDLIIASSLKMLDVEKIIKIHTGNPIFIATSEPTRVEARNAYRIGAKRYILKTFDSASLREDVKRVVVVEDQNRR